VFGFCTDQNEGMQMNYEDKFHKVEDILNNWQDKNFTLPGKITIIKTLAASQLVYIMSSLRTCFKSLKDIMICFSNFSGMEKGTKSNGLK